VCIGYYTVEESSVILINIKGENNDNKYIKKRTTKTMETQP